MVVKRKLCTYLHSLSLDFADDGESVLYSSICLRAKRANQDKVSNLAHFSLISQSVADSASSAEHFLTNA